MRGCGKSCSLTPEGESSQIGQMAPNQEMPLYQPNKQANRRGSTPYLPQPWPSEQDKSQYSRSISPKSTPISGQKGSVKLWNSPAQSSCPPPLNPCCYPNPIPTQELLPFPEVQANSDTLTWLIQGPPTVLNVPVTVFPVLAPSLLLSH